MIGKRTVFILTLFLLALTAIGVACASDLNETDSQVSLGDDEALALDADDDPLGGMEYEKTYDKTKFMISNTGNYYGESKIHMELINTTTNKGIEGKNVEMYIGDALWGSFRTDSKGAIDLDFNKLPGTYAVAAKLSDYPNLNSKINVDIAKIPTSFGISQTSAYYKDCQLKFTLSNILTKKPMANEKISVKFSNGKKVTLKTDFEGTATYNVPFKPGTYSMTAVSSSKIVGKNTVKLNNFEIGKTYLTISPSKLSTTYKNGKKFRVKVTNQFNNHKMAKVKLNVKVYTGKKFKNYAVKTNSKGVASLDTSKLKTGKHKVIVSNAEKYMEGASKTSSIKISKA